MKKNFYWKLLSTPRVQLVHGEIELDVREDPSVHICKIAHGVCTWAQPFTRVADICDNHLDEIVATDDKGHGYTGQQLLRQLSGLYADASRIGQRFS